MVSIYAPKLADALADIDLTDLINDYMAQFPDGTSADEAEVWLIAQQGFSDRIADRLLPILLAMWEAAAEDGIIAANHSAGTKVAVRYQQLIAHLQATWLGQIVSTTIRLIAAALASATLPLTAAALSPLIMAALKNLDRARQIAITEITRVMGIVAQAIYEAAGVTMVNWVTAHDGAVCKMCETNQNAGPWPLGVPFPSGATAPPQHVRCRCAIVPAHQGDTFGTAQAA